MKDDWIMNRIPDIVPLPADSDRPIMGLPISKSTLRIWADHFASASSSHDNEIDFFSGKVVEDLQTTFYAQNFYPTALARVNMIYLQTLASMEVGKHHQTKREGLRSYLFAITFAGSGYLRYEGQEYTLESGSIMFLNCRLPHEYHAGENGWCYRFFHFDGTAVPFYFDQVLASNNVCFRPADLTPFQKLFGELVETNRTNHFTNEIVTNRILTDILTLLVCELPRFQEKQIPVPVQSICHYIEQNFDRHISLDHVADSCGLSKYHMCRIFKDTTGISIITYLTDFRLDIAQRLLRNSERSIEEISDCVGFPDRSAFYRAFRARETMSPKDYRKFWKELL